MLNERIRKHAIAVATANSLSVWMEARQDELVRALEANIPAEEWAQIMAGLDSKDQRELALLQSSVPTSFTFHSLDHALYGLMGDPSLRMLKAADRMHFALARSDLLDATTALARGDYPEARDLCQTAADRIDWMLNGKARTSTHPRSHIPLGLNDKLVEVYESIKGCVSLLRGVTAA